MIRSLGLLAAAGVFLAVGVSHAAPQGQPLFARGKLTRTVDGVRFSFIVPRLHPQWENGPIEHIGVKSRIRSLFISKSMVRGQSAEAVIFWTGFPDGGEAAPCTSLLSPDSGRSTGALAAAMARAPGTKVVRRPTRLTLGGRPATHVVLRVRKDLGCDPGFFFTWSPSVPDGECWGACWLDTHAGDTIRVWIVDVDGKRLVIEAATEDADMPASSSKDAEQEIGDIIRSIRFR